MSMKTSEVFKRVNRLSDEILEEHKKLSKLNLKCLEIMNLCSHEIVFKYVDNQPRKMIIDGSCFCPACGKTITCIKKDDIKTSAFRNSRIISLTHLSLIGTKEVYSIIRNEVYDNMDIYYNKKINENELSNKMEEVLVNRQQKYKALTKRRKYR